MCVYLLPQCEGATLSLSSVNTADFCDTLQTGRWQSYLRRSYFGFGFIFLSIGSCMLLAAQPAKLMPRNAVCTAHILKMETEGDFLV